MALALKQAAHSIEFSDLDSNAQRLASDLLGSGSAQEVPDIVLIATPINSIFETLLSEFERNPQSIFMDIGGLKSNLLLKVEEFPELSKRFISLHPMAGREVSGAISARADLFEGRALLITESSRSSSQALDLAFEISEIIGAQPYRISANDHDRVIALVSHLPQAVASALGATLAAKPASDLTFSGAGLRDTSRLAGSEPKLWRALFLENSKEFLPIAKEYLKIFSKLIESLEALSANEVEEFFESGRKGREQIPGKHGGKSREYTYLPIVIDDKPGQLAKIFDECARANVNVEDLSIEHSPGQEKGLVTLALSSNDAVILQKHLLDTSWRVQAPYTR
jgi:prephenate dehydrogenase